MKMRPLHDNIIIRRSKPEQRSKGGIIITDAAQEKNLFGEVLAVGPGKFHDYYGNPDYGNGTEQDIVLARFDPMPCKVGDVVLVAGKYAGQEVHVDGETYLVVKAEEIAAVMETA